MDSTRYRSVGAGLTPLSINDRGQIVGVKDNGEGFLDDAGVFTDIIDPEAVGNTSPTGINNDGEIVGSFSRIADGSRDGENRSAFTFLNGVYQTKNYQDNNAYSTSYTGINGKGDIVGSYPIFRGGKSFSIVNGVTSQLPDPTSDPQVITRALGINSDDQIVGYFYSGRVQSGFLYQNGSYAFVNYPGATATAVTGINDKGVMVGYFRNDSGLHGFIDDNGKFSEVDFLGQDASVLTGINNEGAIIGYGNNENTGANTGFESSGLFSISSDNVDFNNLNSVQQSAVQNGGDLYNGMGGDDVVTLPSTSNYKEDIGGGETLGWNPTNTFTTGSRAGDKYTLIGSDGSYKIQFGAGEDSVTINGDGSSTITGGAGIANVTLTGDGDNTITGGAGTADIKLSGAGFNTLVAGSGAFGAVSVGSADSLAVMGRATTGDLTDDGKIDVSNGLTVGGFLSGSGKISIGAAATLQLDHFLGHTSPTLSFADGTGRLIIDANGQSPLAGTDLLNLDNVQVGDTIDIRNFNANYASIHPEVTKDGMNSASLYVSDNSGQVLQFGLDNIAANTSFSWSPDGSGGTILTSTEKPSILDLANISANVYIPKSIPGWDLLSDYKTRQVAAYANPDKSQIVITIRGTEPSGGEETFKDVISDLVSIGEDVITESFSSLVSQATSVYNSITSSFKNAAITFTGHSLGGGVAELLGEATGIQTDVFNAPGIQQIYLTVKSAGLLPTASAGVGNIGPIVDYREPYDWVSVTGIQAGDTETIEAGQTSKSPILNHYKATVVTHLDSSSTTIKNGYNGFILPVKTIADVAVPVVASSTFGLVTSTVGYLVDAYLKSKYVDPETGTYFTFSQSKDSPEITSVNFIDNGVAASYKIWADPALIGSAYTVVAPGQSVSFGTGSESFGFEALDADGNPITLPDGFLFEAFYAAGGNVDATLNSSDLPFFPAALPVCFTSGTCIGTVAGEIAVEKLSVGDLALTSSGEARPIRWLGHRTIECREPNTMPVRIAAGAFGDKLPQRDLYLSPGHPVLVGASEGEGGHLVPIMCLINGTTIDRVKMDRVTYWHVELDEHDILLAEGLPAESYIDLGSRLWFAGANGALYNPDMALPGMPGRCRPVAADGPVVEAERRRLDAVFAGSLVAACAWPREVEVVVF